jgi:hypothetical protein
VIYLGKGGGDMKTKMVGVRFPLDELADVTVAANKAGMTLSQYVRSRCSKTAVLPEGRPVGYSPAKTVKAPAVLGKRAPVVPFSEEDLAEETYLDYSCGQ